MNTESTRIARRLAATALGASCSVALVAGAAAGLSSTIAKQVWGNTTTQTVSTSGKITAKQVWGNAPTGTVHTAGYVTAKQVWGNGVVLTSNNTWGN